MLRRVKTMFHPGLLTLGPPPRNKNRPGEKTRSVERSENTSDLTGSDAEHRKCEAEDVALWNSVLFSATCRTRELACKLKSLLPDISLVKGQRTVSFSWGLETSKQQLHGLSGLLCVSFFHCTGCLELFSGLKESFWNCSMRAAGPL